jgi:hypothetical protein
LPPTLAALTTGEIMLFGNILKRALLDYFSFYVILERKNTEIDRLRWLTTPHKTTEILPSNRIGLAI